MSSRMQTGLQILAAGILCTTASAAAVEIMSWIPPYGLSTTKTVIETVPVERGLTRLGLQFWAVNTDGSLKKQITGYSPAPTAADIAFFRDAMQSKGVEVLLCVYDGESGWNWDPVALMLADDAKTTAFINDLLSEMRANNLDGIDLDLERSWGDNSYTVDMIPYQNFVARLADSLHAEGKVLTIDTFHGDQWNAPNLVWWDDWAGKVDNIHSMGYGELYQGNADPIFTFTGQQSFAVQAGHDSTTVLVGVPGYTDSWGSPAQSITQHIDDALAMPTPIGFAIWDLRLVGEWSGLPLTEWRDPATWDKLAELKAVGQTSMMKTVRESKGSAISVSGTNITFTRATAGLTTVSIRDLAGKEYYRCVLSAAEGTNNLTIPQSSASGVRIVTISGVGYEISRRFVTR